MVNEYVIGAVPVAVTWKPAPLWTLALLALVIAGATCAAVISRVKIWFAAPAILVAVMVKLWLPTGAVASTFS